MKEKMVRIGIDVGGTFTHAVALDAASGSLLGKVKVPTSHHSPKGVGEGILDSYKILQKQVGFQNQDVLALAHSTTQATNALLEGDVDPVGIVALRRQKRGFLFKWITQLKKIPLFPGKGLQTHHCYLESSDPEADKKLDLFLKDLRSKNVRVVVVIEAFSNEDETGEKCLVEYIKSKGFYCVASHEIAQLYGIKIRLRTAVVNAALLPKMLDVTEKLETELKSYGVTAPLMMMRSDGGVMTLEEMKKRPVLSLLSGPAAGIAAALRYLRISQGVFLEVGGTSTDISFIKNGRAVLRSATIGGQKTFLKTLDCRTLGIGGGSLPRVKNGEVIDVGPRSAHIAGADYFAFFDEKIKNAQPVLTAPKSDDPEDYLVFKASTAKGERHTLAVTTTCAANANGFVKKGEGSFAHEQFWETKNKLEQWAAPIISFAKLCEQMCAQSAKKIADVVHSILSDYKTDPLLVSLIGGGGGATAIVPIVSKHMNIRYEVAKDAEVISAIGVALGLIRDVVEKSCVDPSQDDLKKIRAEAVQRVVAQGADASSVDVRIEVDAQKHVLRAEAQGSLSFKVTSQTAENASSFSDSQLQALVKEQLPQVSFELQNKIANHFYAAVDAFCEKKSFWRVRKHHVTLIFDAQGVNVLKVNEGIVTLTSVEKWKESVHTLIDQLSRYDDAGMSYPFLICYVGAKPVDLSKLATLDHVDQVIEMEQSLHVAQEQVMICATWHSVEESN